MDFANMIKNIFVVGVTRMRGGYVCISGITEDGQFVRPEIKYQDRVGIHKTFLFDDSQNLVLRPLVKVELDFIRPKPQSQFHTEDWIFNGNYKPKLIEVPTDVEKKRILQKHTDHSLEVALADQNRSLIIIKPQEVPLVDISIWDESLRCHLTFRDQAGDLHRRLPVTDANWLAVCRWLWMTQTDKKIIPEMLRGYLRDKEIFLRIGITREFQGQKWRQISGVFSIPDWLGGRTFADFGYDFDDHV